MPYPGMVMRHRAWFVRFSNSAAHAAGRPLTFLVAFATVLAWAVSGPLFGFSDTWQLVINTGTTVVAFLMVFLIQNTQNRDSEAMHLKLDELIRAVPGAHDSLLDIEELDDETLERMCRHYALLARRARGELAVRRAFTFEGEEDEGLAASSPSGSRALSR
jgi:low affinity Fe/Cu permease